MSATRTGIAGLALAGALYVGVMPIGPVPALGRLLDPAHGVWAAARVAELPREQQVTLDGLSAPVDVRYDDRGVPHIFATTELDAMRTLGWVHARDRLFQMELTVRKVAGTLSEVAGPRTLPIDRQARERGLAQAAEAKWMALPVDSRIRAVAVAYVEGINQWVRDAGTQDLPVEYKLLGTEPMVFQSQYVYYMLAEMSQTLAWQSDELQRGAIEALIGAEAAAALFPLNAPIQEPIQPVPGRTAPRRQLGRDRQLREGLVPVGQDGTALTHRARSANAQSVEISRISSRSRPRLLSRSSVHTR